ncbi:unnamed protein product [Caenorhabditis auriculariae]|uniref:Uncharacterized protein n=1 Tax=Caenorhabditis auriculariae TaxID=2777116 RepID=A0A8S1HKY6_9PELO|nr:unnamed protein product [Caenorhabditis auriculariae]
MAVVVAPKMTLRNICSSLVFIVILASCVALFVLHSLYFIFRTASQTEKQELKTVDEDQLFIPSLVICNRMPFSQDGVNAVNVNMRQDAALRCGIGGSVVECSPATRAARKIFMLGFAAKESSCHGGYCRLYLLEWTNPSMREAADFSTQPIAFMQQGQNTVMQYLSTNNRNQTLSSMQYQCQSVINSCSFQGIQLSSFDCCRNLVTYFPSTNGLCWLWRDATMWQNSTSVTKQFSITFQMTRNSWYSQFVQVHPGVDVYLQDGKNDINRMATELENPIRLMDKRGVRLLMNKQERADIRRPECGQSLGDARRSDRHAFEHNNTNYLICELMVAMRYCNCHPLIAEMLQFDPVKFRDFNSRVLSTSVCSVEAYDNCARRYVDIARIENWNEKIPNDLPGRDDAEKCRSTMKKTEILLSKDPNIYELLSYIGYNIALWFTIGHILWSLFAMSRNVCCPRSTKIVPGDRKRVAISTPTPILVESTPATVIEETTEGEI